MKNVRYAVIGLGHIAQVAVLPAFKNAKSHAQLVALVTGDFAKGKQLQKKYRSTDLVAYEELPDYLAADQVDAVYICLPNDQHYQYTKMALECGVHVLCEKPFTLQSDQARELAALAVRKNLKLMVAYRLHFEASNLKAIELAHSGAIGELRYWTSHFSFQVTDPANIRLQAKHGGGPLWDIGTYCINAARYLFRSEPIEVMAMAEGRGRGKFKEVDEMVSVSLRFPKNCLAQFTCSFGAAEAAEYFLYGTKGHLRLKGAYEYATKRELELKTAENQRLFRFKKADQFGPEIVHFSECIHKDRQPWASAREGRLDIRVIEGCLESLQLKRPVRLRPVQTRLVRPRPQHKIFRSPFPKPDEVRVRSPHA